MTRIRHYPFNLILSLVSLLLVVGHVSHARQGFLFSRHPPPRPTAIEDGPTARHAIDWSTYLGGSGEDIVHDMAADVFGNVYVTGSATSGARFSTVQRVGEPHKGGMDAYVAKFDAEGRLHWVRFLGGRNDDVGHGIALGHGGDIYVVGGTDSPDFPATEARGRAYRGQNWAAFIAKLDSGGGLTWARFMGGEGRDVAKGVTVDGEGNAYVVGHTDSLDFPTHNNFHDTFSGGASDAFAARFTPGGALAWSCYLGGPGADMGQAVGTDMAGGIYITGWTTSGNLPGREVFGSRRQGSADVFLLKLSSGGNVIWTRYLRGSGRDEATAIAVDIEGGVFITGHTRSENFPTHRAHFPDFAGQGAFPPSDAFVARFDAYGNMIWSTFLGGGDMDQGWGIGIGPDRMVYVGGLTHAADFPVLDAHAGALRGPRDGFVAAFARDGQLVWSRLLGGSGRDQVSAVAAAPGGRVFVAGQTNSTEDFPVRQAHAPAHAGGMHDAFVTCFMALQR